MPTSQPGDILLFRGNSLFDRAIRFSQARRPSLKPYSHFTHTAIALGPTLIVEAVSRGVVIDVLDDPTPYTLVRLDATPEQRAQIVKAAEARVGTEYGFLEDLLIGLNLLFGWRLPWRDQDSIVCSEVVAEDLAAAGLWPFPVIGVGPAELAMRLEQLHALPT